MGVKIITPPVTEPITLDEMKAWCRIDATGDAVADMANDVLLTSLVAAARGEAENNTRRVFLPTVLELSRVTFPGDSMGIIELPRPPLIAVSSVTYVDANGVTQTMAPEVYTAESPSDSIPAVLYLVTGSWPATALVPSAVRIRYTAGWTDAAAVPENIKTWIKVRVATLWANRENIVTGNVSASAVEMPGRFLDGLLDRWTIKEVA